MWQNGSWMSRVFTDSYSKDFTETIHADQIIRGGAGYGLDNRLPDEVEHTYPDYRLYPQFAGTAYGFLSRGCPRGCGFCIVGQKEGRQSGCGFIRILAWRKGNQAVGCEFVNLPGLRTAFKAACKKRCNRGFYTRVRYTSYYAGESGGTELCQNKAPLITRRIQRWVNNK